MSSIPCVACARDNASNRKFCGGCGVALAVACGACEFVNQGGDRFCGGCGVRLESVHVAAPVTAGNGKAAIDIAELLRTEPVVGGELPHFGIGQDDVDRLFGGGS